MKHTTIITKNSKTGLGTHTVFCYDEEDEQHEVRVMPKNAAKRDDGEDSDSE